MHQTPSYGVGYPLFLMTVLAAAVFSSAIALTGLFPYVGFMIVDIGAASTRDEAGYWAGSLASAMMFGRFFSSFWWGQFADSYGRKPALLIGCFTVASMSVLFGCSTNITTAIVARLLLGLLNPIWGIAKTLVSELCSREYEAQAMGLTAGCWSLGMVFGPMMGGMLANPAKLYPGTAVATIALFQKYPYLLPNLVTTAFATVAMVLVFLYLPETLEDRRQSDSVSGQATGKRGATIMELLHTPGVAPALTALFILSFVDLSFNEIVPLWAMSSRQKGGLAMEQLQIGWLMSFTGVILVVYTFLVYARIVKLLGRVNSYRVGQAIFIPFSLGLTLLSTMPAESSSTFWLLVVLFAVGKACCSLGNSSLGLIINRSVPKEQRASVNGLSMSIGSASKAVGPMSSAYIFAWSIATKNNLSFPFDYHLVYVFLCFLAAVCASLPLHYDETEVDAAGAATIDSHQKHNGIDCVKSNDEEKGSGDDIPVIYQSDDEVEMKSMLDSVAPHPHRCHQHRSTEESGAHVPLIFKGDESRNERKQYGTC